LTRFDGSVLVEVLTGLFWHPDRNVFNNVIEHVFDNVES
jgi:hypothetical protein